MADLIVFAYRPGASLLHRMDMRCKLVILLLINLLSLNASFKSLIPVSLAVLVLFLRQRIPLKTTLFQIRLFLLLLLFVIVSRMIFTEGDPLVSQYGMTISRQGVQSGLLYGCRLLLVLLCGILFISTSKVSEIKVAIQWFLKPLPWVPEKRVAMMMSLMIRFLPLILEQGAEIAEAQKARAVERVKNPIRRLSLFTIPLLRRIFETADKLVLAMESRSYTEDRTDPDLKFSRIDLYALLISLTFMVLILAY